MARSRRVRAQAGGHTLTRKLGIQYRPVKLSRVGEAFSVSKYWHPIVDAWNPLYEDILRPFDFNKYVVPRPPVSMGGIPVALFESCPSVLRLPIKWGGSDEVRLPKEVACLREEIGRILQYDRHINPYFTDFFVHITIDNGIVEPGTTQRFPGFHGDGLQGGKFKQKLTCEHSYIYTSVHPTVVALQPFFVAHINEDRYNIFRAFDQQVRPESLFTLRAGHLYLIDPYIVHASPVIHERCRRTFFRLTVTPSELLMPKNTVNPMFEGQGYPARIDVREFVAEPDVSLPLDFYGLGEYLHG